LAFGSYGRVEARGSKDRLISPNREVEATAALLVEVHKKQFSLCPVLKPSIVSLFVQGPADHLIGKVVRVVDDEPVLIKSTQHRIQCRWVNPQ